VPAGFGTPIVKDGSSSIPILFGIFIAALPAWRGSPCPVPAIRS
jgi:hypothetical protein